MVDAYYNGEFLKRENISIPLTDRAVFFGDGVYDAAIGRNGKIFMLDEHVERIYRSAATLDIPTSISKDELKALLLRIVDLSEIHDSDFFIYFQFSRYSESRIHAYPGVNNSNLLITVNPISIPPQDKRLRLISYPDIRYELCNVKTINLIPAVIASKYAEQRGADEAVFVRNGIVTECAHSNIHMIKNGILYTHPQSCRILSGISRMHLLSVCERERIEYKEIAFTPDDLKEADSVLVTSSSKIVLTAESFDENYYKDDKNSISRHILNCMRADYKAATEF